METHQYKIQQNGAYSTLLQADSILKQLEDGEKYLVYRDQLTRLHQVLNYCREKLERSNLQLLPIQHLDTLQTYLAAFKNNIEELIKNNNEAYLNAADSNADLMLNTLAYFPPLPDVSNHALQKQILQDYEEEAQKLLKLLREKVEDFEVRFKIIHELLNAKNQEISDKLEKRSQEIQENLVEKDARLSEELKKLRDEIDIQKTRFDSIISEYNQQFITAQGARLETFNADLKQWREQYEGIIIQEKETALLQRKELQEESDKLREILTRKTDAIIAAMETQKNEASKLLEVVGITTLAGHYKRQADKERAVANLLRIVAILLMLFPAALLIKLSQNQDALTLQIVINHTLLAIAFFVPAFYIIHESAKHRKQEVKTRQFELELAAVAPYFEAIPNSDQKNQKRIDLADSFFGHPTDDKLDAWEPPAFKVFANIVDSLGNFAKKLK